jgi:L-malate glycosyltransferase
MTERLQRLRVCHLASGDLWAGAEVMICELLRKLHSDAGLQVSAIVLNRGRLAQELMASGVAVKVIDEREHSLWSLVRQVRKILAQQPVDIVHSHRYKENLLAWLSAGGALCLATQHGLPEYTGIHRGLKQWLNGALLGRGFDQVVAVSSELGSRLQQDWPLPATRLTVIPNGVVIPAQMAQRQQRWPLVIGSAGRLVAVKDFPLLIETAAVLRRSGEPVRFVLAGDGPQRSQLQELINRHGLAEDFTLTGEVADMGAFYRGLDIYINTSRHEGLPMSILEALAHGLPVIAPAVGGIGEVVRHQREGLLITSRESAAFAQACRRLLHDRPFRLQAGEAGRQRVVAKFSTAGMADRYRQLYGQLVKSLTPAGTPVNSRGAG